MTQLDVIQVLRTFSILHWEFNITKHDRFYFRNFVFWCVLFGLAFVPGFRSLLLMWAKCKYIVKMNDVLSAPLDVCGRKHFVTVIVLLFD